MPTVLRVGPYRFFFYASDRREPPHIHVERDDKVAKFWLQPVRLERSAVSPGEKSIEFRSWSRKTLRHCWGVGMNTLNVESAEARAQQVKVTSDTLTVDLTDGRTISVPLAWFPRLLHASAAERNNWRFIANGEGIHWTDLDEDISVEGLLLGQQSHESHASLEKWLRRRQQKSPSRQKTPNKTLQPPSRARR